VNDKREQSTPFLDIEETPENPGAVVLPIPYERTTSYLKGTARGPSAILAASAQVELYDEESGTEPFRHGIATLPPVDVEGAPETVLASVGAVVERELGAGRFVCSLGGEHTVTVGAVGGAGRVVPDLAVVSVDAHADLRDEYQGSKLSHACVARRLAERGHRIVEVGIRSLSAGEARILSDLDITVVQGREVDNGRIQGDRAWIQRVVERVASRNVYLTVDLDGLDPSVVPGVGTPEPGGLLWFETLDLIAELFGAARVVAADVVELRPIPGDEASAFAAARLVYKILGHALEAREA